MKTNYQIELDRELGRGVESLRAGKGLSADEVDAQLAAEAESKVFLRLARKDMDRARAVLALNAGTVPVYMHIPGEKITLLCPRDNWCSGDGECLRRLKDELGAENVVLKQKG